MGACQVHGPGDDECLGARCLTPENTARRYSQGRQLQTVTSSDFNRRHGGCPRHGNPYDAEFASAGGCWECHMERAIAYADAHEYDGMEP